MSLPGSGPISTAQITSELGYPAGTPFSFNSANARFLANKPTGSVSVSNMYGRMPQGQFIINPVQLNESQWGVSLGGGHASSGNVGGYG